MKNKILFVFILLFSGILLKFCVDPFLNEKYSLFVRILSVFIIISVGAFFVLKNTANIIEETTDVLHERTKIAGGVLQSLGTAFPDMVLGIVAALTSLKLREINYSLSINYAIIAASTTFGSNIYNIGHAIWCIYRQNLANILNKSILMFPFLAEGGTVKPISVHKIKPSAEEINTATDVLVALTILTSIVAMTMVIFGKITSINTEVTGDLYQLIKPVGVFVFIISILIIYIFRKSKRQIYTPETITEEKFFKKSTSLTIWLSLIISGITILFAAESMVNSIQVISEISHIPVVVTGVLAGIIGCLGEMIVVHNFSIHPEGRIGDAIVGVAMDNIVTIMGASIVAIIGGVFLGGNALILIFVLILTLNTILIWQINKLKNCLQNTVY